MKWFLEKFMEFNDRPAVIDKGKTYSYSELYTQILTITRNLQSFDLNSPGVVTLKGRFSFKLIASFFALFENNHTIAILAENDNEWLSKTNLLEPDASINIIEEQTAIIKLSFHARSGLMKSMIVSGHSGMVLFTSGTTGKPKAILHDLDILLEKYRRNYIKDLNCLPLLGIDHIGGFDILSSLMAIGATITIPEDRSPQGIAAAIERHKVNVISATPTFLNLFLLSEVYKEFDLTSLSIIGYGSEPMPEWLLKQLNHTFPGVSLQQKYGISETNAIRIKSKSDKSLFFKIDDPQVEFQIVEHELWIKSPNVFHGYLGDKENETCDGWYKTGDIVEKDDEGYLHILGRKSDIINVGGEKVFPSEIEQVIIQLPYVNDCRVYAEKSLITGNIVVADIHSTSTIDLNDQRKEIRKYLLDRIARHKIPVKINFVESIEYSDRLKKKR